MTNLASLWEGLGSQDGPKLAPNRFKNDSPNQSKKWSHFESLLGLILIDFGVQLGSQEGAQEIIFRCFCWLLSPSWGQDSPKTPQEPSKSRFWSIFGPILIASWTNFIRFFDKILLIFEQKLLPFCLVSLDGWTSQQLMVFHLKRGGGIGPQGNWIRRPLGLPSVAGRVQDVTLIF